MVNAILSQRRFHNEDAAFDYVEAHLWPRGPVCPHCKATSEKVGAINARTKPSKKHPEGLRRHGLRKCYACRKEFTVRVGTIFEDSHLPLHLWLQAIHLLTSGKKGVSTRHIQRLLNCSMKTAWFLTHRIREIMKPGTVDDVPPMGGLATTLEADEVYIGAMARRKKGPSAGREAYRRGAGRAERTGPSTSSEAHLHRYLNEFDYRYNHCEALGEDDSTRAALMVRNAKGRHLTYRRIDENGLSTYSRCARLSDA